MRVCCVAVKMDECNIYVTRFFRTTPSSNPHDVHGHHNSDRTPTFIRLDPDLVQQWYIDTLEQYLVSNSHIHKRKIGSGWTIASFQQSNRCESSVEFLPISITYNDETNNERKTIYSSYNGGNLHFPTPKTASMEGSENFICIPPYFSVPANAPVSCRILTEIQDAQSLWIEPVSADDWELIEANASWLEEGGLLKQVSVVYSGQIIPLNIGKHDVANVRILPTNFRGTSCNKNVWPGVDQTKRKIQCLRLVNDTEVIVSPKPRLKKISTYSSLLRLYPTEEDYTGSQSMIQLKEILEPCVDDISLQPGTAALNPSTLSLIMGRDCHPEKTNRIAKIHLIHTSQPMNANPENRNSVAFVRITTSAEIPDNNIAIHPLVRMKLKGKLLVDYIEIRLLDELEVDKIMYSIPNFLQAKGAKLMIRKLNIGTEGTLANSSWHFPENCCREELYSSSNLCNRNRELPLHLFKPSSRVPDLLIEIGGFLPLPLATECSKTSQSMFLMVDYQNPDDSSRYDIESFMFAKDIEKYLFVNNRGMIQCEELVYNHQLPTSRILFSPLPPETVVPKSFLSQLTSLTPSSAFICGESGSGKTTMALLVSSAYHFLTRQRSNILYLDCKGLKCFRKTRLQTILEELTAIFEEAIKVSPSVLVLDDLDELIKAFDNTVAGDDHLQGQNINPVVVDQSKVISDYIRKMCMRLNILDEGIVHLIITCRDTSDIPKSIISDCSIENVYTVPIYTPSEKMEIAQAMHRLPVVFPSDDFMKRSETFRPRDIEIFLRRLDARLLSNTSFRDVKNICAEELIKFVPLSIQGSNRGEVASCLKWSEVGGLFNAKAELVSTFIQPSKHRRIYMNADIRLPRGALLYGPPGTGKSIIPAALAHECKYQLFRCRGPEILDKYIGASEAKVRSLFNHAAGAAPSIIFLDDLDSLAPRRGSDHTGVTDRIVNQLLTFLDGVEDTTGNKPVFVIASTSRPDKVDPALLRPGRLEKHIFLSYADNNEEWTDLFVAIALQFNVESSTLEKIKSGHLIMELENRSIRYNHFTGADVRAVFNRAQLAAVYEVLENQSETSSVEIVFGHLLQAFEVGSPALAGNDFEHLQRIYSTFGNVNQEHSESDGVGLRHALR